MKNIKYIVLIFLSCFLLTSCQKEDKHICEDYISDWIIQEELICEKPVKRSKICTNCGTELLTEMYTQEHKLTETVVKEVKCEEDGIIEIKCELCDFVEQKDVKTEGHKIVETVIQELSCTRNGKIEYKCEKCGQAEIKVTEKTGHKLITTVIKEATCTEDGVVEIVCEYCAATSQNTSLKATGHTVDDAKVLSEPTATSLGVREYSCKTCNEKIVSQKYVDNGYFKNGKLSVRGTDLVNEKGKRVQLFGLSTHGLQWFGRYANFKTIAALQEGFGLNIIRFALYTAENGYCDGSEKRKEQMLSDLIEGIDAATKLGLYVIIDWHMVGAESIEDKNPLTYLEESKAFFSMISEKYKNQDNILYEIMNEPNGSTRWDQCKQYAEEVIPCIRKNSDGIILVGNPRWTADLNSVMADPLVGYNNIMYTYHFYAADHSNTSQVVNAYDRGFPVFISEFGFMESSGNGQISEKNGEKWRGILDARNISYVAWNISNSQGDASIFKPGSSDMTSVEDSNLKPWGIYLKNWYRIKSGISQILDA